MSQVQSVPAGLLSCATPELGFKTIQLRKRTYEAAFLPKSRLDDFLKGEGERTRTTFFVRKKEGLRTSYHCSYGPQDFRQNCQSDAPIPKGQRKRRREYGQSCKRGCLAEFDSIEQKGEPDVVQIRFKTKEHIDSAGKACHGPEAEDADTYYSLPKLSKETREWVRGCVASGAKESTILEQNKFRFQQKYMVEKNLPSIRAAQTALEADTRAVHRDYFLTYKDIKNIAADLDKLPWRVNAEQAENLKTMTQQCPENVLLYQEFRETSKGCGNQPFMLAWTSKALVNVAVESGHGNLLSMESTFATNYSKFPMYTLLAFDAQHNGIPVAWFVTGSKTAENLKCFLAVFISRCQRQKADFQPSCILTENDEAAQQAVKLVLKDIPIHIPALYAKTEWTKAIKEKVGDGAAARVWEGLEKLRMLQFHSSVSNERKQKIAEAELQKFYRSNPDETAFMSYFKEDWAPKIGMWSQMFWNCQPIPFSALDNQEMSISVVKYHGLLKEHIFETNSGRPQACCIDWLVYILLISAEEHYLPLQPQSSTFSGFKRLEKMTIESSVAMAINIPDDCIELPTSSGKPALLRSTIATAVCCISCPGTSNASCSCQPFLGGRPCEHILKVAMLMLPGLGPDHLVHHLGTYKGSGRRGLAAMYSELQSSDDSQPEQAATAQLPQSGPAAQSAATASQGDQHAESSDLLAMRNEACEEIASAALLLDRITSNLPESKETWQQITFAYRALRQSLLRADFVATL